jgi:hypothetical protein
LLVVGVLAQVAEDLCAGLPAQHSHCRPGRDAHQPQQRQRDADQRGQRDDEVETLDTEQATHLGQFDHLHHDGSDDERAEYRLGKVGEHWCQHEQGQQHGQARDQRRRAPLCSLSELADRLVETGMPWNSPAPAFAIPCATDSWLMSTW